MIGFNFDNSYLSLPDEFYSKIDLNKVANPKLFILNENLAKELNLNIENLKDKEGVEILSGNKKISGGSYISQAYAGHQFGYFTMLGDGRAVLIGEHIVDNKRYDIQLKGSGQTPYSRNGDGRAVLGPMLREYLISEAMHKLNIKTTRSLAVVTTGEDVFRYTRKKGAILTRIAKSHIRFGTFEFAQRLLGYEETKLLADYTIKRHYKDLENEEDKYVKFLYEVVKNHAKLVASWQSIGFIHGVMNTDNMTIIGETIDYGPCAFMDTFNKNTVFSSIDTQGRYSYKNQPIMAYWNLCRFSESLLLLIDKDKDIAVKKASETVYKFHELFEKDYIKLMKNKLGLIKDNQKDKNLIQNLLDLLEKYEIDYTNFFVNLTYENLDELEVFKIEELNSWKNEYMSVLNSQEISKEEIFDIMKKSNPVFIPRNNIVQDALDEAENGNYTPFMKILKDLENPFDYNEDTKKYSKVPRKTKYPFKTYCGT